MINQPLVSQQMLDIHGSKAVWNSTLYAKHVLTQKTEHS
jgi:hypothetical protein